LAEWRTSETGTPLAIAFDGLAVVVAELAQHILLLGSAGENNLNILMVRILVMGNGLEN
jgi:hypothetical protein